MSFEAIIEADKLQRALEPVGTLVEECKIRLDAGGLSICAVDPANVGMVDLSLDATAFASYEAAGGVIGVNLVRLTDVVGMADADQLVYLELDKGTRKLHISIDGLEYTLALIDPDSVRQEPDLPDLYLPATTVIEGRDIDRAVTAGDMVGDHIELASSPAVELAAAAEGDTDSVDITFGETDVLDAPRAPDERVTSLFSLDYLDDIETGIPADAAVSIRLGDEMPAKLQWSAVDGDLSVVFMLAPRISNGGGA